MTSEEWDVAVILLIIIMVILVFGMLIYGK